MQSMRTVCEGKTLTGMKKPLFIRIILFIFGLYGMGLGVAFSIVANLGTTPISSIPYVLSVVTPFSVDAMTFVMNIVFVLSQIVILKLEFKPWQLLQIPALILFSVFIDFNIWLLSGITPEPYILALGLTLVGCAILGFSIALMLFADILMMPGDSLARAIAKVTKKDFSKIKIIFDISMVAIAAIISLIFLHTVVGIREGTLIAAISIGLIVKFFNITLFQKKYPQINPILQK